MRQAIEEILRLRRRILILILVLVLLNVGLLIVAALYQAPALDRARTTWGDLRRRAGIAGRTDVAAIYRGGRADLEQLRTHIPLKRQFPRLLAGIFETASSDGVSVGSIAYKPASVKNGTGLLLYGISLSVSGSYAAVKNFLADLQNRDELLVVEGLGMSNSDPFEERVVMDLRLTMYLQEGT
jgi:Tfp pilus assembly protein PilN